MGWRDIADRLNESVVRNFKESDPVIYIPVETGTPIGVVAFFERSVFEIDINTSVSRNVYRPHAFLRLEDLGREPADGDQMIVRGVAYTVTHEERDDYGGVTLYLARID